MRGKVLTAVLVLSVAGLATPQAFAEEGVTKSREAFTKMNTVAQDSAKAAEEVLLAAQAGAKAIGEKMVHNTTVNAQAVFDAAESIARAKTLPEAARLQANFFQQQFAVAVAVDRLAAAVQVATTADGVELVDDHVSRELAQRIEPAVAPVREIGRASCRERV